MPPTTIQSRIQAFEALASRGPPPPPLPAPPPSPSSSSLIDLHEWVVDDGAPLIHLEPVEPRPAPPLPPRKPSLAADHTYPPLDARRHAPASSISSLHSVSLSDTGLIDADSASLDGSYEQVSIDHKQPPPKLPQRPSPTRRQPPPPPPSRSSIHSAGHLKVKRPTPVPPAARTRYDTVFDANILQHRRADQQKANEKPPLLSPEQARETHRRAAGWRGLSVDLITEEEVSDLVEPTEKLEGRFVKPIWRRSRLGRKTLGEIWNECDPDRTGSLSRDQFARGMWRIDEELRRAQVQALKSTSTSRPILR
ncbi:hypothetical protein H2248_009279 [Termitomyces sp. 'cryptogamus']|nr:hypothetical protein H2248_009279 [Termitomyces sp. 'cryptogamus']